MDARGKAFGLQNIASFFFPKSEAFQYGNSFSLCTFSFHPTPGIHLLLLFRTTITKFVRDVVFCCARSGNGFARFTMIVVSDGKERALVMFLHQPPTDPLSSPLSVSGYVVVCSGRS